MTEQTNPVQASRSPLHVLAALLPGLAGLILVGWLAGELWLSVVGNAEVEAMRDLAADRGSAITAVARIVTWAGSAWLLAPLGLLCCAALLSRGRPRESLVPLVSLGGAMLLTIAVKALVDRPRPTVEHLQSVSGPSFPSGHATQASAFWLSLVVVLVPTAGARHRVIRVCTALAIVLVLAVAASRVWLGVHYPSDVVAGVTLGAAWAAWVSRTTRTG